MTQAANLAALGTNAGTTGILPIAGGGTAGTGGAIGFKNRWINGNMAINQRGGTVTATSSEPYSLDRWKGADATSGVFTMQQSSDAPTGSGFQYSLQATVTTATASIAAGDYAFLRQIIEGFNCVDLAWGTASAKTVTVSFWVKSSVTGTYSFTVINQATTQCYPTTYTINAANTWEFKSVTIPGSTTGTWGSTNGIGIYCDFALATGSSYTNTPNSWATSLALGATGQVNWLATNGNTFYLTGCQFEVGTAATNFDVRSYGTELALCLRYYWRLLSNGSNSPISAGNAENTTRGYVNLTLPQPMRTQPSCSISNISHLALRGLGTDVACTSGNFGASTSSAMATIIGGEFNTGSATGASAGGCVKMSWNNASGWIDASAEL